MTLTPIVSSLAEETRQGTCVSCPAPIQQTGIRIGDKTQWSPLRCASCGEAHLVQRAKDRKAESQRSAEDAAAAKALRAERAMSELVVPARYLGVTLENFGLHGSKEQQAVQQAVLRMGRRYLGTWPDVGPHILLLRGGPGTGKGHWVYSVAKGIATAHGASVRVVKLADLVRRLRASWGEESEAAAESERQALRFFRELDLLVIDEVSRHAFYGKQIHQHLYDVLDHRADAFRPTILTTNEPDESIRDILRPALMDRLEGYGGVLEFGDASYRLHALTTGATP